ncbi:hypothetical protein BKA70DRAFT_1216546 [Coprinopsis sp. MPI-PUGE-AT-0042]|nr:hypothetical protein BKA70DRAFT_1216546 [Coprinopsis sp. MPI-PUGE-AT-0042]
MQPTKPSPQAPKATISLTTSTLRSILLQLGFEITEDDTIIAAKGKAQAQAPTPAASATAVDAIISALQDMGFEIDDDLAAFTMSSAEAATAAVEADANFAKRLQDEENAAKVPGPVGTPSSQGGSGNTSVYAGHLNPHYVNTNLTGFTCANCKTHNLLHDASSTWYAVTRGRSVGVYRDWSVVSSMVIGVKGAVYKKYKTQDDAIAAWDEACKADVVKVI